METEVGSYGEMSQCCDCNYMGKNFSFPTFKICPECGATNINIVIARPRWKKLRSFWGFMGCSDYLQPEVKCIYKSAISEHIANLD